MGSVVNAGYFLLTCLCSVMRLVGHIIQSVFVMLCVLQCSMVTAVVKSESRPSVSLHDNLSLALSLGNHRVAGAHSQPQLHPSHTATHSA